MAAIEMEFNKVSPIAIKKGPKEMDDSGWNLFCFPRF